MYLTLHTFPFFEIQAKYAVGIGKFSAVSRPDEYLLLSGCRIKAHRKNRDVGGGAAAV